MTDEELMREAMKALAGTMVNKKHILGCHNAGSNDTYKCPNACHYARTTITKLEERLLRE